MFFSKKKKPVLEQGLILAGQAMNRICDYVEASEGQPPTGKELDMLMQFEWIMWKNFDMARAIHQLMRERAQVATGDDSTLPSGSDGVPTA